MLLLHVENGQGIRETECFHSQWKSQDWSASQLSFTKFVQNVFEYENTAFAEKTENIYEAALIWISDINDPAEKLITDQFNIVYVSSKIIYFLYCRNSL